MFESVTGNFLSLRYHQSPAFVHNAGHGFMQFLNTTAGTLSKSDVKSWFICLEKMTRNPIVR